MTEVSTSTDDTIAGTAAVATTKSTTSSIPKKDDRNITSTLFGSSVPNLFESIHDSLLRTIQAKVATLPFIQPDYDEDDDAYDGKESAKNKIEQKSGQEMMVDLVSNAYTKHLDLAEAYAQMHIFNISSRRFTRTQRKLIVDNYLNENYSSLNMKTNESDTGYGTMVESTHATTSMNDQNSNNNDESLVSSFSSTTPPTQEEVNRLDREYIHAIQKLRKNRNYNKSLQSKLHTLETMIQTISSVQNEALSIIDKDDSNHNNTLHKSSSNENRSQIVQHISSEIKTVLQQYTQLQNTHSKALLVQSEMDKIQSIRLEEKKEKGQENETREFGDLMKMASLEAENELKRQQEQRMNHEGGEEGEEEDILEGGDDSINNTSRKRTKALSVEYDLEMKKRCKEDGLNKGVVENWLKK